MKTSRSPGQVIYDTSQEKRSDYIPAISIKVSSILKVLAFATVVLLVLHILVVLSYQLSFEFRGWSKFYFDREGNLPSYFSSFILALSSLLLGIIGAIKRKVKDSFALHWIILSIIFLVLSVDEMVSFHEALIDPLRHKFNLSGYLRFPWVIAGGIFVIFFCISFLKFFMALPKTMKILFFVSGATYVLGAIGFEVIGASLFVSTDDRNLPYMILMTIEETLEMIGIVFFIYTLMRYLKTYYPKIKLYVE
jgi:hypothetical protein